MALLGLVTFSTTPLFAKSPKNQVQYQEQPKDGKKCSACIHFLSKTKECKVVEGTVAPEGWCTLYTDNPK